MAGTDVKTDLVIVELAKDVGELKGLVSAQTSTMNELNARFNHLSAKMDNLIVYPVWAMTLAFVGAALAFAWKTLGLPLPWV